MVAQRSVLAGLTALSAVAHALNANTARADPGAAPLPLRVEHEAPASCPGAAVLVEEILWRTSLARVAAPSEAALLIRARITRRRGLYQGLLDIEKERDPIHREIEGTSCDDVVSALGLVIALAIDPRAATGRKPKTAPAPPLKDPRSSTDPHSSPDPPPPAATPPEASPAAPTPPPAAPTTQPTEPAGPPEAPRASAPPTWAPPPTGGSYPLNRGPAQPPWPPPGAAAARPAQRPRPNWEPSRARWAIGARASISLAVTPRALFGGGIVAERALDDRWNGSLRFAIEIAATGSFDAGPGGASFLRAMGRLDACALTTRPLRSLALSVTPCLSAEAGALRGAGILRGSLMNVQQETVPWVGLGLLPRVALTNGALAVEVQGGPIFPVVSRTFLFERPAYVIHEVPWITWALNLGASLRFL